MPKYHFTGKERKVDVLSLDQWISVTTRSYSHFVINYNPLMSTIEKRINETGRL